MGDGSLSDTISMRAAQRRPVRTEPAGNTGWTQRWSAESPTMHSQEPSSSGRPITDSSSSVDTLRSSVEETLVHR